MMQALDMRLVTTGLLLAELVSTCGRTIQLIDINTAIVIELNVHELCHELGCNNHTFLLQSVSGTTAVQQAGVKQMLAYRCHSRDSAHGHNVWGILEHRLWLRHNEVALLVGIQGLGCVNHIGTQSACNPEETNAHLSGLKLQCSKSKHVKACAIYCQNAPQKSASQDVNCVQ